MAKKTYDPPDGFKLASAANVVYVAHELDVSLWEKPEKYDTESFKGLKFVRAPLKGKHAKTVQGAMF